MAIKVTIDDNFNNPKVKVLMLKGEKGDTVSAEWGTIIGTLNSQTDLKTALDSKVNTSDIVDNLNSTATNKVLSAKQGKVLNDAIGTKANSSDLTTTNTNVSALQTKVNKKAYYFNNVASMKSASVVVEDFVITEGYYSSNDGGGATYKITDTQSQTDYQEILNNGLYATLIIDNNLNVKQFGAYGDNTHNDSSAFNLMISKTSKLIVKTGTYKIENSIIINGISELKVEGSINYTGSDYCFIIKNLQNKNIYIDTINSENGGAIKIYPDINQYVSFTNIYIKYGYCNKECLLADATNGAITTMILDGIRWRSAINGTIKLFINENPQANTFLTEINIKNIDIGSSSNCFGIDAENKSTNVEIQFNAYELDLENCKGIQTTGKVTSIGIYNCRLFEALLKSGWITINNYCPDFFVINGNGLIYPNKILWNDTTNTNPISTNMTIYDQITTRYYYNGGLLYKNKIEPIKKLKVWKDFTDEITNNRYTLEFSKEGGIYNYLQTTTNAWFELFFPLQLTEFYLQTSNAVNVTLSNGTATRTLDYTQFTAGIYKIEVIGNVIKYTKLN